MWWKMWVECVFDEKNHEKPKFPKANWRNFSRRWGFWSPKTPLRYTPQFLKFYFNECSKNFLHSHSVNRNTYPACFSISNKLIPLDEGLFIQFLIKSTFLSLTSWNDKLRFKNHFDLDTWLWTGSIWLIKWIK